MSTDDFAPSARGAGAAAALLSLIHQHSSTDLRAAARIVSGAPELVEAIEHLCAFLERRAGAPADVEAKADAEAQASATTARSSSHRRRAATDQAPTVRPARRIRNEGLLWKEQVQGLLFARVLDDILDDRVHKSHIDHLHQVLALPADARLKLTRKGRAIALIAELLAAPLTPTSQMMACVKILLYLGDVLETQWANRELVRNVMTFALVNNRVMFNDAKDIARLARIWKASPLTFEPDEPREQLVERLLEDAEHTIPAEEREVKLHELLRRALETPSDGPILMLRSNDLKRRRAEGGE